MKLPLALALFCLAVTGAARAAPPSDPDLVRLCADEMKSRESPDQSHSDVRIVSSKVQHGAKQDIVEIQVTQAEGRLLAARCIIRDGRVFDYKG